MQGVEAGEKTVTEQEATSNTKSKAYTAADGKMATTAVHPNTRIEEDVNMAAVTDKELKAAKKRCALLLNLHTALITCQLGRQGHR